MAPKCDSEDIPSADEIRAAVARIVVSPAFSQSPQLVTFLRFVVEAVLAGKGDAIKSYTIAVDALRRSESFDPARDPIVRVEAGRLRKALARYYAGAGAGRPVLIELPRGSYVPVFRRRKTRRGAARAALILISHLPTWGAWGVALLALIALAPGALLLAIPALRGSMATATVNTESASTGIPVVLVQAFDVVGTQVETALVFEYLPRKLRDALARFDEIEVASEIASRGANRPQPVRPQIPARSEYRITATIDYQDDGVVTLAFRLHDVIDGIVAWTKTFKNIRLTPERNSTEDDVVSTVATTLAQPYGVIYAREVSKLALARGNARYRCLLQAVEFRRNDDPMAYERVRACLEQITKSDPTFAGGFAALAMLAIRNYYENFGSDPAILDNALKAAMRAVELRPDSARMHHAMMNVLFARGQIPAALAEGEKAVSINPYDMTVLIAYGIRLIVVGDLEKGAALLYQAAAATPARPPILNFALFLSGYLLGNEASASYYASLLTNDSYPFALLARALAAARAGDLERARQLVEKLLALHPAWRNDARKRLELLIPSPAVVDHIMRDLVVAGVSDTS